MVGVTERAIYHADDGSTYGMGIPQWVFILTGASKAPLGMRAMPAAGLRPRRRSFKLSTGEYRSCIVTDPTSTFWSAPSGTQITVFGPFRGPDGRSGELMGRSPERRRNV
jgi:hypothetical protein